MKIIIIGAGNVGTNLHHAFALKHIQAQLVSSRDMQQLALLSKDDGQGKIYLYTVADNALESVIAHVNAPKALHIHTSGSMPISVFGADKPHAGVLYCFQSFSKQHLIDDWANIPIFVEGKSMDDLASIYSVAQVLTNRVYEANQKDRERLHIAGVFANNFSNLMYRVAADLLHDTQIPFQALLPLIDSTAQKIHTLSPQQAQTGPASRLDMNVINHHKEVLKKINNKADIPSDKIQQLYQLLTQAILDSNNTTHLL